MAYSILTERYDARGALMRDYLCDTAADLPQPSECIAGSTAYVADEKKKYIVNCCAEWCEQPAEGGGGGGEIDALIDRSITEVASEVESVGENVFGSCTNLTSASFPNATTVGSQAFYGCTNLTSASFPNVKTLNYRAFYNCKKLEMVDFPKATNISGGVSGSVFEECSALKAVNLPLAKSAGASTFQYCKALTNIKMPSLPYFGNYYDSSTYAFCYCYALKKADFPVFTRVGKYDFGNCYSLTAILLRNEAVCSLANINAFENCYHFHGTVNATYNPDGLKDGYIYVPAALVDSYKAATNWSTFADRFRALEDYTVDGTITGALDETKI